MNTATASSAHSRRAVGKAARHGPLCHAHVAGWSDGANLCGDDTFIPSLDQPATLPPHHSSSLRGCVGQWQSHTSGMSLSTPQRSVHFASGHTSNLCCFSDEGGTLLVRQESQDHLPMQKRLKMRSSRSSV